MKIFCLVASVVCCFLGVYSWVWAALSFVFLFLVYILFEMDKYSKFLNLKRNKNELWWSLCYTKKNRNSEELSDELKTAMYAYKDGTATREQYDLLRDVDAI